LAPAIVGAFYLRKSSGSLAMFAAILRAHPSWAASPLIAALALPRNTLLGAALIKLWKYGQKLLAVTGSQVDLFQSLYHFDVFRTSTSGRNCLPSAWIVLLSFFCLATCIWSKSL
jgi:hypothetical protein